MMNYFVEEGQGAQQGYMLSVEKRTELANELRYAYGGEGFMRANQGQLFGQLALLESENIDTSALAEMFAAMADVDPSSVEGMKEIYEQIGRMGEGSYRNIRQIASALPELITATTAWRVTGNEEMAQQTAARVTDFAKLSPEERKAASAWNELAAQLSMISELDLSPITELSMTVGNLSTLSRAQLRSQELAEQYNQYQLYGGAEAMSPLLLNMENMGIGQYNYAQAMLKGNTRLWSEAYARGQAPAFAYQQEVAGRGRPGMPAYYSSITPEEWSRIASVAPAGLPLISAEQAAGGTRGLQDTSNLLQYGQYMMQIAEQQRQRQWGYAETTGVGLGNIIGEQYEGKGSWYFTEEQRKLSRASQEFSMAQQQRALEMQGEQIALSITQFLEKWEFRQRQQQTQLRWQGEDIAAGRQRDLLQRQFWMENWAFQKSQRDISYGWGMEDIEENLRFARGRERRLLLRQQQRQTIRYGMESGQAERQKEQQQALWQLDDEAYARTKERYEVQKQWATEALEMERRHYFESMKFQQERLEMAQQAMEFERAQMLEARALENQAWAIQKAMYEEQFAAAERYALAMRAANEQQMAIANAIEATQRYMQESSAEFSTFIQSGSIQLRNMVSTLTNDFLGLVSTVESSVARARQAIASNVSLPSYAQNIVAHETAATPVIRSVPVSSKSSGTNVVPFTYDVAQPGNINSFFIPAAKGQTTTPTRSMTWEDNGARWAMLYRHSGGAVTGGSYPSNEVSTVLQEGEYVVPRSGVLAVREGKSAQRTVQVLGEILQVLQKMQQTGLAAKVTVGISSPQQKQEQSSVYDAAWDIIQ